MSQDEWDLITRAQRGEHEAFALLVRQHERRLFALALHLLGDPMDAADAVQTGLMRAYLYLGKYRGTAAFATWLHRVVANVCYDELRRRRIRPVLLGDAHLDVGDGGDPGDRHLELLCLRDDLRAALSRLTPVYRVPVLLYYVAGYSYAEVAAALKITVSTVKSRLHRARSALRVWLSEQERTLQVSHAS